VVERYFRRKRAPDLEPTDDELKHNTHVQSVRHVQQVSTVEMYVKHMLTTGQVRRSAIIDHCLQFTTRPTEKINGRHLKRFSRQAGLQWAAAPARGWQIGEAGLHTAAEVCLPLPGWEYGQLAAGQCI
jgi:hypothetical protein